MPIPVLINDELDIEFNIPQFKTILRNLRKVSKIATNYPNKDQFKLDGIIGMDIIEPMNYSTIKVMNGKAYLFHNGIVPIGNFLNFLKEGQIIPLDNGCSGGTVTSNLCYQTVIAKAKAPSGKVEFVLEPKSKYYDPLEEMFPESEVERRLDNMFSCESLGIEDNQSQFDSDIIAEFEKNIQFRDGCYWVKLPWFPDRIKNVPSNHGVALKVLDRVVGKLSKANMYEEYLAVFREQEREGIIERILVDPKNFKDYVWIPHRPVFKTEEQATTKIRPVFNCSLKTNKQGCSLNEAAYPGINLMADLLEMILKFRVDRHVLLADIKKAFLMIKLQYQEDKNKFCFFLKEGNNLACFRYTTLIFGFNCSPFILNYVLKYHAQRFATDECTDMLLNNFYVDNLVKTSNSLEHLVKLYKESQVRMSEGNFSLKYNTNNSSLQELIVNDGNFVEHGAKTEKVLGYIYSPKKDSISINVDKINPQAATKREVLSETSKVFDPLPLCLPVTIRGHLLMRDLWVEKLTWDEEIPSEYQKIWKELSKDLCELGSLSFTRNVVDSDGPGSLYLFSDASKDNAYGFVAYLRQNGVCNNIFSKGKVVPVARKSLPSLELLGVYLAIKCLKTLLNVYSNITIKEIIMAVDAQVVLSWLMTDPCRIKTKNQFAKNRLKDIQLMIREIKDKYKLDILFKYINTKDNPADLLTRGVTLSKFKTDMEKWLHGPQWLSGEWVEWPVDDLDCVSPENKQIIQTNLASVMPSVEPVVAFDKYSSLSKLIGVTAQVLRVPFVLFKDKITSDIVNFNTKAKLHLIYVMQMQSFQEEFSYLKSHYTKQPIPISVRDMDLFIDKNGLLRSRLRVGKVDNFSYEVKNPILLAKKHPLTKLIIQNCHARVKHLGIQAMLNKVRMTGYRIPQPRQSVKNAISSCEVCQRFNSLSFKYPKLTNLPKHRVNLVKAY